MFSVAYINHINNDAARFVDNGTVYGIFHPDCLPEGLAEADVSIDFNGEFDHGLCEACGLIINYQTPQCGRTDCAFCSD